MARRKPTTRQSGSLLDSLTDWHCIGALALLTIIFFRKVLFGVAYFWEDFLYQYYPTKNFAALSIAQGDIPLWNPYTFGGMPFLADIQNGVFYPTNLLLSLVAGDRLHPWFVEFTIILHFLLAGIGTYFLARYLRLDRAPALLSGIIFMFSGYMVTHAIHQTIVTGVAWLPLITLFTVKALRTGGLLNILLAALSLSMSVFAGFPQVFFYIFVYVGCLFLYELQRTVRVSEEKWVTAALATSRIAIIVGFSVALAAVQLLPTVEVAPRSIRAGISYEDSLVGSLSWGQLLTLIVPKFFGVSNPEGYNYWGPGAYFHFWETGIYVGIPTLLLSALAFKYIKSEPLAVFILGFGVFTLLVGLGDGFILHNLLYHYVPGFDKFRSPARFAMFFELAAALCAAMGLQRLFADQQSPRDRKRSMQLLFVVGGASLFFCALYYLGMLDQAFVFLTQVHIRQFVTPYVTSAVFFTIAALLILGLGVYRVISRPLTAFLIIALCFTDLYVFGFSQNNSPTNPLDYFARNRQIISRLQSEGTEELFRVNSRKGGYMVLDRNQGMMDRVFLLEGYTPLALAGTAPPSANVEAYFDMMNVKYSTQVDERERTMGLQPRSGYMPRAYVVFSASVFESDSAMEAFMKGPGFDYRRTVALASRPDIALPETTDRGYLTVEIVSYQPDEIIIDAALDQPGVLVLSEIYYPGWIATVNGVQREILRANGSLRAIPLPAGSQTVSVSFEPGSFRNGAIVSTGAWIVLVVLMVAGWRFSTHREKLRRRREV